MSGSHFKALILSNLFQSPYLHTDTALLLFHTILMRVSASDTSLLEFVLTINFVMIMIIIIIIRITIMQRFDSILVHDSCVSVDCPK